MSELGVENDELVLHLTGLEKVEGVHGDLRVPLSAVQGVDILDDAHGAIGFGFKVGTRIPGVIAVGTVRGVERKVFAAVHQDTPRGVRVRLEGVNYDEWIVGSADPETVRGELLSRI